MGERGFTPKMSCACRSRHSAYECHIMRDAYLRSCRRIGDADGCWYEAVRACAREYAVSSE